jgi:hypothetical protein
MKLAISLHEITSSDRFWNEVVYRLPFWPAGEIVHPLTAAQLKGLGIEKTVRKGFQDAD